MTERDYEKWAALMDAATQGERLTPEQRRFCAETEASDDAAAAESALIASLRQMPEEAPDAAGYALVERALARVEGTPGVPRPGALAVHASEASWRRARGETPPPSPASRGSGRSSPSGLPWSCRTS